MGFPRSPKTLVPPMTYVKTVRGGYQRYIRTLNLNNQLHGGLCARFVIITFAVKQREV
jgi:hypothetical protein